MHVDANVTAGGMADGIVRDWPLDVGDGTMGIPVGVTCVGK